MKKNAAALFFFLNFILVQGLLFADSAEPVLDPYIESVEQAGQGMTLFQVIQSGGWVMLALGVLSMIMLSLVVFLFLRLNLERLIPTESTERLISMVEKQQYSNAQTLCEGDDNLFFSMTSAGLSKENIDDCKEAIELEARKHTTSLWAPLNYLSDIAQIAPMLGLLGTVLGMIQAFNTIAFDAAAVKPLLLAGGVSKAMITSAGGLIIAIIATIFFTVLRTRVETITNVLEARTNQLINAFERSR